jgi:hypothetical protein
VLLQNYKVLGYKLRIYFNATPFLDTTGGVGSCSDRVIDLIALCGQNIFKKCETGYFEFCMSFLQG